MAAIFISYRHTDGDYALLLYAWLKERFGREQLFWDKEDIATGEAWAEVLRARVSAAKTVIALIGRDWTTVTDETGQRRLDSPADWVRIEVAAALARDVLVLPVLTSGAAYLKDADLPEDLKKLSGRQALSMSDARFHALLVAAIEGAGLAPLARTEEPSQERPSRRLEELLRRQVQRLQIRAVELIGEGRRDRAMDELQEGSALLMELLELAPDDVNLDLQLGYLYKTLAQAFEGKEHREEAERYLDLAAGVFQRIKDGASSSTLPATNLAEAINGLGNIYYARGQIDEAIRNYRVAVEIYPEYAYAWHDLLGAYDQKARQGALDLPAMEEALARTRATGQGQPGLGESDIAQLERLVDGWRQRGGTTSPRAATALRARPGSSKARSRSRRSRDKG